MDNIDIISNESEDVIQCFKLIYDDLKDDKYYVKALDFLMPHDKFRKHYFHSVVNNSNNIELCLS